MKCAVCPRLLRLVSCPVRCERSRMPSLRRPAEHLLSHQIRASPDDPPCVSLPSSAHEPVGESHLKGKLRVMPRDRRRVTVLPERKRVKLFLFQKCLRFLQREARQSYIVVVTTEQRRTFTPAIRFSPPLVAVWVMSPWYALTSAEMEVSHSVLTALTLSHESVCN